jgi:hypothetical protein
MPQVRSRSAANGGDEASAKSCFPVKILTDGVKSTLVVFFGSHVGKVTEECTAESA